MQHDLSTLIQEAQTVAREQLQESQPLPGAYLLARRNPQTGAPFTYPTAVASWAETPFDSEAAFLAFVEKVRNEVERLDAVALVISSVAVAEVETPQGLAPQRVVVLRVESQDGVEWMHAPIEQDAAGGRRLGAFYGTQDVADPFGGPLLGARGAAGA